MFEGDQAGCESMKKRMALAILHKQFARHTPLYSHGELKSRRSNTENKYPARHTHPSIHMEN